MGVRTSSRLFSVSLVSLYFFTNCACAQQAEKSFWAERRASVSPVPGKPVLIADLPAVFNPLNAGQLTRQLSPEVLSFPASTRNLVSSISGAYGSVRKVAAPAGPASKKIVIHIQDVHRNPEAQVNIGRAIEELIGGKKINLVALEGAFKPIDLAAFRRFPRHDTIRAVADYLLRENEISGPVHAAFVGPIDTPPFVGVDDPLHYRANVNAYRNAASQVKGFKEKLEIEKRRLSDQKRAAFSPSLATFDGAVESYRSGGLSMAAYLETLSKRKSGISPVVEKFSEAASMEFRLNFAQVENERTRLIGELLSKLTAPRLARLAEASASFRLGATRHTDFYRFLQDLCETNGVPLSRFPMMKTYLRYVVLAESIDSERLFKDVRSMEEKGYASLARTSEERRLIAESRYLYLVGKLADFALTREEWVEYGTYTSAIRWDLKPFESFYDEASTRDRAMADNLLKAMTANGASVAVLVTGGFHSSGIDERLATAGITTITYVPKITQVESEKGSSYLSVFTQEKTPLARLFEGEKLFLAFSPAPRQLAPAAAMADARETMLRRPDDGGALAELEEQANVPPHGATVKGSNVEEEFPGGVFNCGFKAGAEFDSVTFTPRRWRLPSTYSVGFIFYASALSLFATWAAISLPASASAIILALLFVLPAEIHRFLSRRLSEFFVAPMYELFSIAAALADRARGEPQRFLALLERHQIIGGSRLRARALVYHLDALERWATFWRTRWGFLGWYAAIVLGHAFINGVIVPLHWANSGEWAPLTESVPRNDPKIPALLRFLGRSSEDWAVVRQDLVIEDLIYVPEARRDVFNNSPKWIYRLRYRRGADDRLILVGPDDVLSLFPHEKSEIAGMRKKKEKVIGGYEEKLGRLIRLERWFGLPTLPALLALNTTKEIGDNEFPVIDQAYSALETSWAERRSGVSLEEFLEIISELSNGKLLAILRAQAAAPRSAPLNKKISALSVPEIHRLFRVLAALSNGTSADVAGDVAFLAQLHSKLLAYQNWLALGRAGWSRRQASAVDVSQEAATPAFQANLWIRDWLVQNVPGVEHILDAGANLSVLWRLVNGGTGTPALAATIIDLEKDKPIYDVEPNPLGVLASLSDLSAAGLPNVLESRDPQARAMVSAPHQFDVVNASFVLDQLKPEEVKNAVVGIINLLRNPPADGSRPSEEDLLGHPLLIIASPENSPIGGSPLDRTLRRLGFEIFIQNHVTNKLTEAKRGILNKDLGIVGGTAAAALIEKPFHVAIYALVKVPSSEKLRGTDAGEFRLRGEFPGRRGSGEGASPEWLTHLDVDRLEIMAAIESVSATDILSTGRKTVSRESIGTDPANISFEENLTALLWARPVLGKDRQTLDEIVRLWDDDRASFLTEDQVRFVLKRPGLSGPKEGVKYKRAYEAFSTLRSNLSQERNNAAVGLRAQAFANNSKMEEGQVQRFVDAQLDGRVYSFRDLYQREEQRRQQVGEESYFLEARPSIALGLPSIRRALRSQPLKRNWTLTELSFVMRADPYRILDQAVREGTNLRELGINTENYLHYEPDVLLREIRRVSDDIKREGHVPTELGIAARLQITFRSFSYLTGSRDVNLSRYRIKTFSPEVRPRVLEIFGAAESLRARMRPVYVTALAKQLQVKLSDLLDWMESNDIYQEDLRLVSAHIVVDYSDIRSSDIVGLVARLLAENRLPTLAAVAQLNAHAPAPPELTLNRFLDWADFNRIDLERLGVVMPDIGYYLKRFAIVPTALPDVALALQATPPSVNAGRLETKEARGFGIFSYTRPMIAQTYRRLADEAGGLSLEFVRVRERDFQITVKSEGPDLVSHLLPLKVFVRRSHFDRNFAYIQPGNTQLEEFYRSATPERRGQILRTFAATLGEMRLLLNDRPYVFLIPEDAQGRTFFADAFDFIRQQTDFDFLGQFENVKLAVMSGVMMAKEEGLAKSRLSFVTPAMLAGLSLPGKFKSVQDVLIPALKSYERLHAGDLLTRWAASLLSAVNARVPALGIGPRTFKGKVFLGAGIELAAYILFGSAVLVGGLAYFGAAVVAIKASLALLTLVSAAFFAKHHDDLAWRDSVRTAAFWWRFAAGLAFGAASLFPFFSGAVDLSSIESVRQALFSWNLQMAMNWSGAALAYAAHASWNARGFILDNLRRTPLSLGVGQAVRRPFETATHRVDAQDRQVEVVEISRTEDLAVLRLAIAWQAGSDKTRDIVVYAAQTAEIESGIASLVGEHVGPGGFVAVKFHGEESGFYSLSAVLTAAYTGGASYYRSPRGAGERSSNLHVAVLSTTENRWAPISSSGIIVDGMPIPLSNIVSYLINLAAGSATIIDLNERVIEGQAAQKAA